MCPRAWPAARGATDASSALPPIHRRWWYLAISVVMALLFSAFLVYDIQVRRRRGECRWMPPGRGERSRCCRPTRRPRRVARPPSADGGRQGPALHLARRVRLRRTAGKQAAAVGGAGRCGRGGAAGGTACKARQGRAGGRRRAGAVLRPALLPAPSLPGPPDLPGHCEHLLGACRGAVEEGRRREGRGRGRCAGWRGRLSRPPRAHDRAAPLNPSHS